MGKQALKIIALLSLIMLAGCYVYPYPYPPPPEPVYYGAGNYERSWGAALDAMEDAGVRIVSADRNTGVIKGTRDGEEATVTLRTQADGRVRVAFSSSGSSGLSNRIYQAYERRMGR